MKEIVPRVWWKVPLYSMLSGYAAYWFMLGVIGPIAYKKLPDGTVSSNDALWMLASGAVFVAVVLIGGLLFFRRMTRRELLCSATVMFFLDVALAILSLVLPQSGVPLLRVYTREWYGFVTGLLSRLGLNNWIGAVIGWSCVYLLVLFGKKDAEERK